MLSKDTQVPVPTDWIVTIVEPISSVSKMYEETIRGNTAELISHFEANKAKGEFVIVIAGKK